MKQLFAYIRVSTPKQGKGVSLKEQRTAIEAYAARMGATIVAWFEEKRTAAKAGRPEFAKMVKLLRQGGADGVVIHKVDRSTRNFRDWAEIDELIEAGIEVHFANETLDLNSRGGRLAADVQVVVAVDYIRNLREEALKGIHGRLKQGILPHAAPLGYLDRGAGKPKEIDSARGPLIRHLFELYAQGGHSIRDLTAEGVRLGLRNKNGNPLRLTQIHWMLRNIFYAGVIKSARYGLFAGAHEPIVPRAIFDRVQEVLSGKFVRRTKHHFYLFRRLIHCATCRRSLVAGMAKGNVYYRCATVSCPTTSLREDAVAAEVLQILHIIALGKEETTLLEAELAAHQSDERQLIVARRTTLENTIAAANARSKRLTSLLIDEKIDSEAHEEARAELVLERQKAEDELRTLQADVADMAATAREIVELARRPVFLYETADDEGKRLMLQIMLLNCEADGKSLEFSLREPFATIAERHRQQQCRPYWDTPRTSDESRTVSAAEILAFAASFPKELMDAFWDTSSEGEVQAALEA